MQAQQKIITLILYLRLMAPLPALLVLGLVPESFAQMSVDSARLINDLRILSSKEMEGRITGSNGHIKARNYIQKRLALTGVQPLAASWLMPFGINNIKGYPPRGVNVAGILKGQSDSAVVVMAHYDHLGKKENAIYFGADDNASGVAVLLEAARILGSRGTAPQYTVIFAALDAEEVGLLGAEALAGYLVSQKMTIKLVVNMDMVSKNWKNELYVCGTYHYPQLKQLIDTTGSRYAKVHLKLGHDFPGLGNDDWTTSSDHGPFHLRRIPFLYFGVEDHVHYHQPTDTFESTPFSFFLHSAQTITGLLNVVLYKS